MAIKTVKHLYVITLTILCVLLLACVGYAEGTPVGMSYQRQSYAAVAGNAGMSNAGKDVTLMLLKSNADITSISKNDIGYINQTVIGDDGEYTFEFEFSGFTYDSEGNVDNYKVVLNVNGEKITPSISKATVMSEMLSFDIDISKFGKAVADITNEYNLKKLKYKMVVAFYDEGGKLLNVKTFNKYTGDEDFATYGYRDVPEKTAYAKGFLWESWDTLVPVANMEKTDIESRPIKVLMIGNSLTVDATRYLTNLTEAGGVELYYKTKVFSAATIEEHAANLDAELNGRTIQEANALISAAEKAGTAKPRIIYGSSKNYTADYADNGLLSTPLKNEQFDIISIQTYSSDGGAFSEEDFEALGKMVSQIRALQPEAEIILYEPWLHYRKTIEERNSNYLTSFPGVLAKVKEDIPLRYENITSNNRPLASVPVAEGFYKADNLDSVFSAIYPAGDTENLGDLTLEWTDTEEFIYATGLYRDFAHASYYGCYLTHAMWYEFLTGEIAPTTDNEGNAIVGKPDSVNDDEHLRRLEILKNIAHEVLESKTLPDLWENE